MELQELTPEFTSQYGWKRIKLRHYLSKGYKKYGNHLVRENEDKTKTIILEYERNIMGIK